LAGDKTQTASHNKQTTSYYQGILSLFDAEASASEIGHWILSRLPGMPSRRHLLFTNISHNRSNQQDLATDEH